MTGFPPAEFVSREVSRLHEMVSSRAVVDQIQRSVAERRSVTIEIPMTRRDGSMLLTSTNLAPVLDDEGRCIAIVGLHTDVTERRKQEAAERERQKLLALGALAGGVAHEINNLLQPVISLSQLAWESLDETADEERRGDLEMVLECSRAARDIVKKILLFSRKEGTMLADCDLPAEVRRAVSFVRALLPTGVTLREAFADGVAGTATINSGELMQVLTNLAINAGHAMDGHGTVTVGLSTTTLSQNDAVALELRRGDYFVLTAADTGCGMDEAVTTQIFDPFFTTKPQGQGTGLGLSVAYGIVRNWGGSITVQTALGRGTTFILHIPVSHPSR
jgi:PAS domain S-box-containing protein